MSMKIVSFLPIFTFDNCLENCFFPCSIYVHMNEGGEHLTPLHTPPQNSGSVHPFSEKVRTIDPRSSPTSSPHLTETFELTQRGTCS